MNTSRQDPLDCLHRDLGLKRLNPVWAKLEIILGLIAGGIGVYLLARGSDTVELAGAGVALFTLGGYLALAGHRSHLYQSNNRLVAHLADLIRKHPRPPETPL